MSRNSTLNVVINLYENNHELVPDSIARTILKAKFVFMKDSPCPVVDTPPIVLSA